MFSGFAGLWLILYWHNARILPAVVGFDASHHLNYIGYLQEHHSLPARHGNGDVPSSAFYYIISALALSLFNPPTADPSAMLLLRALTMPLGIAQFVLVFAALRLIFQIARTFNWLAAVWAAFLPMQLYMSYYPTNETLAALLASASLYFALRMAKPGAGNVEKLLGPGAVNRARRC